MFYINTVTQMFFTISARNTSTSLAVKMQNITSGKPTESLTVSCEAMAVSASARSSITASIMVCFESVPPMTVIIPFLQTAVTFGRQRFACYMVMFLE